MLEHMGIRWGYVFLHGAAYLDGEEIKDLMVQAVEMYLAGDEEREVKGAGVRGEAVHGEEVRGDWIAGRAAVRRQIGDSARGGPGGVFGQRAVAGDGVVYF